jgi:acetyl-CoA C-acetyltransferase
MEHTGFSERGSTWSEVLTGTFDSQGTLPIDPDGGLKSFGHPVGASGLRMLLCWLQFRGRGRRAPTHRAESRTPHNLGGGPGTCVSIVGRECG